MTDYLLKLQCLFSTWFYNVRLRVCKLPWDVRSEGPTLFHVLTSCKLLPGRGTDGNAKVGEGGDGAPSTDEIPKYSTLAMFKLTGE